MTRFYRFAVLVAIPAALVGLSSVDSARAGGAFTIQQLSPSVQADSSIGILGPYFDFLVTNTSGADDSLSLDVLNLVAAPTNNWFPQVCLRDQCFPFLPTSVPLAAGATDTIGVNVTPFSDGIGTFDFYVESVNDPSSNGTFGPLTLYGGTAATNVTLTNFQHGVTLSQNSPNPVRSSTTIRFSLEREQALTLSVFDVNGRLVRTLRQGASPAGSYSMDWDGTDQTGRTLPSGVYFYRLESPSVALTKKMTLTR